MGPDVHKPYVFLFLTISVLGLKITAIKDDNKSNISLIKDDNNTSNINKSKDDNIKDGNIKDDIDNNSHDECNILAVNTRLLLGDPLVNVQVRFIVYTSRQG